MTQFMTDNFTELVKLNDNKTIADSEHLTKLMEEDDPGLLIILDKLIRTKNAIKDENQFDDMYYEEDVDSITMLNFLILDVAEEINDHVQELQGTDKL